jgi:hypothetical protein
MIDSHVGSTEFWIFIRDGRRRQLQTITNDPTKNMTSRFAFLRVERFKFQRIGSGKIKIMISWAMLKPAAA